VARAEVASEHDRRARWRVSGPWHRDVRRSECGELSLLPDRPRIAGAVAGLVVGITLGCSSGKLASGGGADSGAYDGGADRGEVAYEGGADNGSYDAATATECIIGTARYPSGFVNPANACEVCQPSVSSSHWTRLSMGPGCDTASSCDGGPCVVAAVAAGGFHACALVGSGVQCWGMNNTGQLGNNSDQRSPIPVPVQGLGSGVQTIAVGGGGTGFGTSCALINGGAHCWGMGSSDPPSDVPVQIPGLESGVQTVAAGLVHGCAVVKRSAVCWGQNQFGQLGNGSTANAFSLVTPVQGLAADVELVAVGINASCAVVAGGLHCWGYNYAGQLGNGSVTDSPLPVQVQGLGTGVEAVAVSGTIAALW